MPQSFAIPKQRQASLRFPVKSKTTSCSFARVRLPWFACCVFSALTKRYKHPNKRVSTQADESASNDGVKHNQEAKWSRKCSKKNFKAWPVCFISFIGSSPTTCWSSLNIDDFHTRSASFSQKKVRNTGFPVAHSDLSQNKWDSESLKKETWITNRSISF